MSNRTRAVLIGGAAWLSVLLAPVGFCAAQIADTQPATQPIEPAAVPPAPTIELSVAELQRRLDALESTADLDEAQRSRAQEMLRNAIQALTLAKEWAAETARYREQNEGAPAELERIRAELAVTPEPVRVEVAPDETAAQLEQRLAARQAELRAVQERIRRLNDLLRERTERRARLPDRMADATRRLEETVRALAAAAAVSDEPAELHAAREAELLARKYAAEQELEQCEQDLAGYETRGALYTAQRDLAQRDAAQLDARIEQLQELVGERRRKEAEAAAQAAEQARLEAARLHPVVKSAAEANAELARLRADAKLSDRIEEAIRARRETAEKLERRAEDFKRIEALIEAVGLTSAIGLELRVQREDLRDIPALQRAEAGGHRKMAETLFQKIQLRERQRALISIDARVNELMADVENGVSDLERADIRAALRDLLTARREIVDSQLNDYESYYNVLIELDKTRRELIRTSIEFREYVDRRILWVASTAPLKLGDFAALTRLARWVSDPDRWREVGVALADGLRHNIASAMFFVPALGALFLMRRRLRARLTALGEQAEKKYAKEFAPTAHALLVTALLAALLPGALYYTGWLLFTELTAGDFAKGLGRALMGAAVAIAGAITLREICRPKGLAQAHFEWPVRALRVVRRHLLWVLAIGAPLLLLSLLLEYTPEEPWKTAAGRLLVAAVQIVFAVFMWAVLHPTRGALREYLAEHPDGMLALTRFLWRGLLIGGPILLALLACIGYYYTSLNFFRGLVFSLRLALIAVLIYALVMRWVLVSKRRLALDQLRKRREAERSDSADGGEPEIAEPQIDLPKVGAQVRQLTGSFLALSLLLALWVVWTDVMPGAAFMDNITLWTTKEVVTEEIPRPTGPPELRQYDRPVPITLSNGLFALMILAVTVILGRNVPGLLEISVLPKLPLQGGERYAIVTITRYFITIVGLVMMFGAVGIGWSQVQWLAAAATLGLGFGLQEIFANFVSGLIILFERPIRVGDIVTVGNVQGRVTRIRIRATTITDWDRRELLVPNKEFITGQLINWTLTDQITRVIFPVGVAYGSDTEKAQELLLKAAIENPWVMSDPAPSALFLGFGDSALNMELRVFLADRNNWGDLVHTLNTAIDRAFRKAGIEIAFPQQDIHIRTIPAALAREMARAADEAE